MSKLWDRLERLPAVAEPDQARAAVLVALYRGEEGEMRIILTRRPDFMRTHPGDVVYPGGRIESGEGPVATAIREAEEEIGLPHQNVAIIGGLDPVSTRDPNNVIVPVVAVVNRPEELVPDPNEVDLIIEPPVTSLLDEDRWITQDWYGHDLWFFEFTEGILWGASAFITRDFLSYVRD